VVVIAGAPKPEISVGSSVLAASPALTYQWYYGDNAIPGATSQFLSYNPAQYGIYRVVVTNAGGCSATSDNYINLVTGMEGTVHTYYSFPNPFSEVINIALHVKEAKLYDVTGQIVTPLRPGVNDVSHVRPGLYLLRVRTETGFTTLKLTK
jgi:hypothetical protein